MKDCSPLAKLSATASAGVVDKRAEVPGENLQDECQHLRQEITTLKQQNTQLRALNQRANEKLNAALDGNGLCLWEQHVPTGELRIFNMAWGKMLGYESSELEATVDVWKQNLHPDDKSQVLKALNDHLTGHAESYEAIHRMLHKDGSHSWVSDRGRIVEYDQYGAPLRMMGTHIDITQEKRYELHLAKLANMDPLTGLLNRKALSEAFDRLRQKQTHSGGALMFIDLDGFKAVNDQYGHKVGDIVLTRVASLMSSLLAKSNKSAQNTRLARFGGDEFVILHQDSDPQRLAELAQQMLAMFDEKIEFDNGNAAIGLSIGICCFGCERLEFDQICDRADLAMYQVKRQGKHNFAFWQPQ